jgi:hypothetical protein
MKYRRGKYSKRVFIFGKSKNNRKKQWPKRQKGKQRSERVDIPLSYSGGVMERG